MQASMREFESYQKAFDKPQGQSTRMWLSGSLLVLIAAMFLPWTQNIRTKGNVTTLRQEQRAQGVTTIIPGRIVKWYIKEGDIVHAGDTIAQLTEVKEDYLDPNLVANTKNQRDAKADAVSSYEGKVGALDSQMSAINNERNLKSKQAKNKIKPWWLETKKKTSPAFPRPTKLMGRPPAGYCQIEYRLFFLGSAMEKRDPLKFPTVR